MLTRPYVEALSVDQVAADQVGELRGAGVVTNEMTPCAWWRVLAVHAKADIGLVS